MTTTDTAAHDVEGLLERLLNMGPYPCAVAEEAASLIRQLRDENGALKHDIERYVAISSEEATRAESAVSEAFSLRSRVEALETDMDEFLRRVGPRWCLEQPWFPPSMDPARRTARAVKGGGDAAE